MRPWLPFALLSALGCDRSLQGAYDVLPPEGAAVPAFEFRQLDGARMTPADLAGKPTVVALWSSTCGASRQALAAMVALREDYASRGVGLAVIADDTEPSAVQRILDSAGVRLPVALAAGQITATFARGKRWPWQRGVALPSFLLLDGEGKVRHRVVGVEADSTRRLERVRRALEAMIPADTGRVTIDGGSLFYEAAGTGDPVILIHGGNLDRRMWDSQFELLRRQYRVVRYDARGFGRSSPADQPFAAHDDLAALLRGLHIARASLVGLSMGGRIAIDLALTYPNMVDRLVLAAPGISGGSWAEDGDTLWLAAARSAAKRGDSVGVALAWLGSAYIRTALQPPDRAAWIQKIVVDNASYWMGIVRHQDLEREASPPAADRLAELRAPVLLLVGDEDTPFIHDVARAIGERASRVRRVDLPSVGHMLNLEATESFNTALLQFLASPCPPNNDCSR